VSDCDQLAELGHIAYRQPDAGKVRSHAITLRIERPLYTGFRMKMTGRLITLTF
jgi:hypothetical protein